ncbi:MAG: putative toxin-antitoxin system toxin component, PIN family [Thiothrix nivea]|nr:MAG: putative toxin-antitoxin system toxin component, PIN family [Thiothrix nivea]
MVVTLDTNVLLAALMSRKGASHYIFRLILNERLKLALTTQLLLEYDDVLKRQEIRHLHGFSDAEVNDVLDLLFLLAGKHAVYFRLRPNLADEGDNLVFECAFTSNSDYLVTSNTKDFKCAEWQGAGFDVLTPAEFCQQWRLRDE